MHESRSSRLVGYARVSTVGQTLEAQLEQLTAAECDPIFREKASGGRLDRKQLQKLLRALRASDTVVVTRIDRLARKLAVDPESALRSRIIVAPKRDPMLMALNQSADWRVSTAVVVEGILRLISSNPRRDTNVMLTPTSKPRSSLSAGARDRSPLREVYLSGNDNLLFTLMENYTSACNEVFWARAGQDSFIRRTVGVQALFDILRVVGKEGYDQKDISKQYFTRRLHRAGEIDFSRDVYRNASGSGRSLIRRAIEAQLN